MTPRRAFRPVSSRPSSDGLLNPASGNLFVGMPYQLAVSLNIYRDAVVGVDVPRLSHQPFGALFIREPVEIGDALDLSGNAHARILRYVVHDSLPSDCGIEQSAQAYPTRKAVGMVNALESVSGKLACGHTLGGVEWVSGSTGRGRCGCVRGDTIRLHCRLCCPPPSTLRYSAGLVRTLISRRSLLPDLDSVSTCTI